MQNEWPPFNFTMQSSLYSSIYASKSPHGDTKVCKVLITRRKNFHFYKY